VALTDAGIRLDPTWLENLTAVAQGDQEIQVVYGHYEPFVRTFFERCASLAYVAVPHRSPAGRMRGPSVASMLLFDQWWEAAGGFPDLRAGEPHLHVSHRDARCCDRLGAGRRRPLGTPADTAARSGSSTSTSSHGLFGDQHHDWHHAVVGKYLMASPFAGFAVVTRRWWWGLAVAGGAAARVGRSILRRREDHGSGWLVNRVQFVAVALVILTIDVATFLGLGARHPHPDRRPWAAPAQRHDRQRARGVPPGQELRALMRTDDDAMKMALFATGPVGLAVARLLTERDAPPVCLVVDSNDAGGGREELRDVAAGRVPHVLSSDDLISEEAIRLLRTLELDLGILAWWPRIVGPELRALARLGFLNFHPSLLPWNRGKDPNFWALVEQAPFGVTLHFIDAGIDSGDIAFQQTIDVSWEDTGETLYRKAQREIVALFARNLDRILAADIPRLPQDPSKGSFHRRDELERASEIRLDATYEAAELLNLLRARTFSGRPAAWFSSGEEEFEVRVDIRRRR